MTQFGVKSLHLVDYFLLIFIFFILKIVILNKLIYLKRL